MLDFLFTIIIYPIQLLLECVYAILSVSIFKENTALSLAVLSLFVNLLCLPLYAKAEQLQQNERAIQKRMAKRVASIKKHFKGDEQYMILSMYYRENHYHPIMALRSSLSLLLQIPFFIAAYSFLSHLEALHNKPLFLIHDLSAPDALLSINGISINVLPILMTIINSIAGIIYSKGLPLKEKIQLYVMSLLFLALLYNSPAALVLYWTMNNVFSLVKNIMFKIKKPLRIVYIAGCLLCAAFMIYVCFFRYNFPMRAFRNKIFSVAVFLFFCGVPLYIKFIKYAANKWFSFLFEESKYVHAVFLLACAALWVLIGCYVPINLVASDPVHFASISDASPFQILYYPAVQAMGLFLFWTIYIFFLTSPKIRPLLSAVSAIWAFCTFANFFVFTGNYGIISETLTFSIRDGFYLHDTLLKQAVNISACIVIAIFVFLVIFFKKAKWLPPLLFICMFSSGFLCVIKAVQIKTTIAQSIELRERTLQNPSGNNEFVPAVTFSKTEKNVLVIMLDGAINSYFSLFLKEKPEFSRSFDGFVYYPNTIAFYRRTLFGTPPLFGGYEYATYNMNKRSNEKMRDKHNEAIFLLPTIFREHNFDVSASNLPYVNYGQPLDPDFYSKRGIQVEKIIGRYTNKYIYEVLGLDKYSDPIQLDTLLRRNLFMLAVLETSIFTFRDIIYQNGRYWSTTDYTVNSGVPKSAIDNYTALFYLPRITKITNTGGGGGTLTIMINDLTHDPAYLQYPNYTVEEKTTDQGKNFFGNDSFKYYHVNSASYILLAKWFDYLREAGIWDNTRIIIVSDHGDSGITHLDFSAFQNNHILPYNSLLLFKDFGSNEPPKTNNDFMTTADVPFLALKDIV
ncbi:MAG: membrane protein insertase YidC, partial [Treponema sp.]|nr:membrane protein insertase YidC [Treponema sp.]